MSDSVWSFGTTIDSASHPWPPLTPEVIDWSLAMPLGPWRISRQDDPPGFTWVRSYRMPDDTIMWRMRAKITIL